MNNRYKIGQRIKKRRSEKKLTQAQLAESLNISVNFLSEIENGKRGLSQDTISKICKYFNTTADYILFGKEEQLSGQDIIKIAESLTNDELSAIKNYLTSLLQIRNI